jgi:GH18 family chitinase
MLYIFGQISLKSSCTLINHNIGSLPYIKSANAKGLKTWLRVGSYWDSDLSAKDFSNMTADPLQRSKLISMISATLDKYEMDGVYIFWKYPGCPVEF